jgi:hypothetical protein
MGVLDDAIRQHLELKRAHGAAEDEVQRQEHEALGPARREQAPAEPEPAAAVEAEPEPAVVAQPEAEAAPEPSEPEPEPPEPEPVAAPEPEVVAEPEPEPEPERAPTGDTPTKGFDALEEPVPEQSTADEEDVLEETPDFLQETPEHDRLWFEQKPPRDFDFDE